MNDAATQAAALAATIALVVSFIAFGIAMIALARTVRTAQVPVRVVPSSTQVFTSLEHEDDR